MNVDTTMNVGTIAHNNTMAARVTDDELIAHAPTDIAALVSEVEQLRALQRALNTVLDLVEDEEVVNMFARVFEAQEALLAVARKIR